MNADHYRTTIEFEETDDGWRAWEPNADNGLVGTGSTSAAAVRDYAGQLEARQ